MLNDLLLYPTLCSLPDGHPAAIYTVTGAVWTNSTYGTLGEAAHAQLERTAGVYFHTSTAVAQSITVPLGEGRGAVHASVQLQQEWVIVMGVIVSASLPPQDIHFAAALRDTPVGALLFAHDWASTPLGQMDAWDPALKTAASQMLAKPTEACLFWGPERTLLYNDAWKNGFASSGVHQMGLPGRITYKETWDSFSEACALVDTGQATIRHDDLVFFDTRSGDVVEPSVDTEPVFDIELAGKILPSVLETYYSWSYTPVYTSGGTVGGVMNDCRKTTDKVLAARRLNILRELSEKTGPANTLQQFWAGIENVLLPYSIDFPYVLCYKGISSSCDGDGDTPSTERSSRAGPVTHLKLVKALGIAAGHPQAAPSMVRITMDPPLPGQWPFSAACERGQWLRAPNPRPDLFEKRGWGDTAGDAILMPLGLPDGGLLGLVVLGLNTRRPYDDDYLGFHRALAGNLSAGLAATMAYEQELRQAEELRTLDRAKTVFFQNVSHELRTPLTLIRGPADDALSDPNLLDPVSRSRFRLIHRASGRLLRLVNSLMLFSSAEARRLQAVFRPVRLGPVTSDLASLFRSTIEKIGIQFDVRCNDMAESRATFVDLGLWEQIVFNLLSNAAKYTMKGKITVTMSYSAVDTILKVHDTGCGIPEDELERVMERFHRVDSSQGRSHEGTGIGLALTSELVKIHSGSITVESKLGVGSTFVVRIPLGYEHLPPHDVDHDANFAVSQGAYAAGIIEEVVGWIGTDSDETSDATSAGSVESHAPEKYTVLVVEDNLDARSYIKSVLMTIVKEVVGVGDGQAALDYIHKKARPDLILTDVMMPRMTGLQLVAALENDPDPSVQSIPVIVLSAVDSETDWAVAPSQGQVIDFLPKPFTSVELLNRVRTRLKAANLVKRQGAELKLTKRRYQRMSELAPVAIFESEGSEGMVTYANERFFLITGLPRVLPVSFDEVVEMLTPGSQAFVLQAWDYVADEGKPIQMDFLFTNGQSVFAEVKRLEDGTLLGTFTDQTEQRRFAASQLQLERAKTDEAIHQKRLQEAFVDIVSHELRNPLSAIIQSADLLHGAVSRLEEIFLDLKATVKTPSLIHLLQDGEVQLEDANHAITCVALCARHQTIIAGDILSVSRLDSNLLALTTTPFHLLDELRATLNMYGVQASTQGIDLNLITADNITAETCIVADPTRFSQILVNLISNSCRILEAWEGQRRVTIKVSLLENRPFGSAILSKNESDAESRVWLEVRLSDSGPGIPLDDQAHLFTRFNDVHSGTGNGMRRSSSIGGTGLGLYLCKKLAELQGGQIRHVSSPGEGAAFWFFIEARVAPSSLRRPILNRLARAASPMPMSRTSSADGAPAHKSMDRESTPKAVHVTSMLDAVDAAPTPVVADGVSTLHVADGVPDDTPTPKASDQLNGTPSPPNDVCERPLCTVLIVEDNIFNQRLLQRQLQIAGFQTATANNGLEALNYLEAKIGSAEYPSVILMDLEMPIIDGFDTTIRIREWEGEQKLPPPKLPVFAVTGNARAEQVEAALSAGMDTVFIKPYVFSEVVEKVDAYARPRIVAAP